jgi:hypothetical protein
MLGPQEGPLPGAHTVHSLVAPRLARKRRLGGAHPRPRVLVGVAAQHLGGMTQLNIPARFGPGAVLRCPLRAGGSGPSAYINSQHTVGDASPDPEPAAPVCGGRATWRWPSQRSGDEVVGLYVTAQMLSAGSRPQLVLETIAKQPQTLLGLAGN